MKLETSTVFWRNSDKSKNNMEVYANAMVVKELITNQTEIHDDYMYNTDKVLFCEPHLSGVRAYKLNSWQFLSRIHLCLCIDVESGGFAVF